MSLENVQLKYDVHLNYLQYFKLTAVIPNYLKRKARENAIINRDLLEEWDVFYPSNKKVISLTKI